MGSKICAVAPVLVVLLATVLTILAWPYIFDGDQDTVKPDSSPEPEPEPIHYDVWGNVRVNDYRVNVQAVNNVVVTNVTYDITAFSNTHVWFERFLPPDAHAVDFAVEHPSGTFDAVYFEGKPRLTPHLEHPFRSFSFTNDMAATSFALAADQHATVTVSFVERAPEIDGQFSFAFQPTNVTPNRIMQQSLGMRMQATGGVNSVQASFGEATLTDGVARWTMPKEKLHERVEISWRAGPPELHLAATCSTADDGSLIVALRGHDTGQWNHDVAFVVTTHGALNDTAKARVAAAIEASIEALGPTDRFFIMWDGAAWIQDEVVDRPYQYPYSGPPWIEWYPNAARQAAKWMDQLAPVGSSASAVLDDVSDWIGDAVPTRLTQLVLVTDGDLPGTAGTIRRALPGGGVLELRTIDDPTMYHATKVVHERGGTVRDYRAGTTLLANHLPLAVALTATHTRADVVGESYAHPSFFQANDAWYYAARGATPDNNQTWNVTGRFPTGDLSWEETFPGPTCKASIGVTPVAGRIRFTGLREEYAVTSIGSAVMEAEARVMQREAPPNGLGWKLMVASPVPTKVVAWDVPEFDIPDLPPVEAAQYLGVAVGRSFVVGLSLMSLLVLATAWAVGHCIYERARR